MSPCFRVDIDNVVIDDWLNVVANDVVLHPDYGQGRLAKARCPFNSAADLTTGTSSCMGGKDVEELGVSRVARLVSADRRRSR